MTHPPVRPDVKQVTRQKDPARDAALTESFHRMLRDLKEPPRPPDGVLPVIVGWVQLDVRFMTEGPDEEGRRAMREEQARAMFVAAGFEVHRLWQLPNRYQGNLFDAAQGVELPREYYEGKTLLSYPQLEFLNRAVPAHRDPWWLVRTPFGLIEIGWRKRVISIDWSDTGIRAVVTTDNVTKSDTMVHAWSEEDAFKYLKALRAAAPEFSHA